MGVWAPGHSILQTGSLLPRLTMGSAPSGLPVPSGPFDCLHLFAHGVRRVSSGPGPGSSPGSSNFHPWLFVLMFYAVYECWVSKDLGGDPGQTSCSAAMGETEAQRGKGAGWWQNRAESCGLPESPLPTPVVSQKSLHTGIGGGEGVQVSHRPAWALLWGLCAR